MTRHTDRTLPLDPDVIGCLVEVMDPEIGLGVVDLSLVYQATRGDDGIVAFVGSLVIGRRKTGGMPVATDAPRRHRPLIRRHEIIGRRR